jgi:hypothetical protein
LERLFAIIRPILIVGVNIMSWKKFSLWMREHWMLALGIALVIAAIIAVSIACAFAAPAVIAFFSGLSAFGFAPFAAIATWSTVAASAACVGIVAAAVALSSALFNLVYTITNALNNAIVPKADEFEDLFDNLVEEPVEGEIELEESAAKIGEGLAAPRKGCCAPNEEEEDQNPEEPELDDSKNSKEEPKLDDSKKEEPKLDGSKKEEPKLDDSKKLGNSKQGLFGGQPEKPVENEAPDLNKSVNLT